MSLMCGSVSMLLEDYCAQVIMEGLSLVCNSYSILFVEFHLSYDIQCLLVEFTTIFEFGFNRQTFVDMRRLAPMCNTMRSRPLRSTVANISFLGKQTLV